MKAEIKKRWLARLRDPSVKKAIGHLHGCDGSFCAIGLLYDEYLKDVNGEWENVDDLGCRAIRDGDMVLCEHITDWSLVNDSLLWGTVIRLNDNTIMPLPKIADAIESMI